MEALAQGSILWIGELNLGLALFVMALVLLPIEALAIALYGRLDRKLGALRIKRRRQGLGYED